MFRFTTVYPSLSAPLQLSVSSLAERNMSYRSSSDAYSRRPAGDDRRNVDLRDRRRESLQRSISDSYKEDRHRRDADAVPRDRRLPSDASRDAPSVNSPTKPPNSTSFARPEPGTRTGKSDIALLHRLVSRPACFDVVLTCSPSAFSVPDEKPRPGQRFPAGSASEFTSAA